MMTTDEGDDRMDGLKRIAVDVGGLADTEDGRALTHHTITGG